MIKRFRYYHICHTTKAINVETCFNCTFHTINHHSLTLIKRFFQCSVIATTQLGRHIACTFCATHKSQVIK